MAGALTISTLNNDTGVLATQNGMTGIAKAWVKFSVNSGGTVTVNGNFNMSSVTRNSAGQYTFTMTTALVNANYSVVTTPGLDPTNGTTITPVLFWTGSADATPTTTSFQIRFAATTTGGAFDPKVCGVVVNGD